MQQSSYVARLVYRIVCPGIFEEQYEEQWRLIFARDERAALAEARRVAEADEESYTDQRGRRIRWQLIAVKDLLPVALEQGSLLASIIQEVAPLAEPHWAA